MDIPVENARKILCVFPRYTASFATFEYAYPLVPWVHASMPPQGLLVIAAALPKTWQVRFVDENMAPASFDDFAWADAVFVSGMHIQRRQIEDIRKRAHAFGKVAVLGGPSVSASPQSYPGFDYIHIGELGDATEALFATLARDVSPPREQIVLETSTRRSLRDFPLPAYELINTGGYFVGSVQFSSGCPFSCEFCDIPSLYGRVPRFKTPAQILAELDKLMDFGVNGAIYFVDDNFIAHRRALRELLPHLVEWQKRNGYAVNFICEATLDIARLCDVLALMREAGFTMIFCGIETPDSDALKAIDKAHNMRVPILDAVRTINSYGMEVASGIILGLDTDTKETGNRMAEFIEQSKIPMATINLLQALPRTPLFERLRKEKRLLGEECGLESNVDFKLPYDDVLGMWRACMATAYRPEALFARYEHQMHATWPNRIKRPPSPQRLSKQNIAKALKNLSRIIWLVGIRGDYRGVFWKFAWRRLMRGELEQLLSACICAHHLINYAREACAGRANASHYSAKVPAGNFAPIKPMVRPAGPGAGHKSLTQ